MATNDDCPDGHGKTSGQAFGKSYEHQGKRWQKHGYNRFERAGMRSLTVALVQIRSSGEANHKRGRKTELLTGFNRSKKTQPTSPTKPNGRRAS